MRELEILRRRYSGYVPGLLGAKKSYAVLCPLVEVEGVLHLLFEVRAAGLRQGGEVCFPGGRSESDEQAEACALRETFEELAIPPSEVQILGRPDFICNQAGFLLQPVLGLLSPKGFAAMKPSPSEVADVFTVPISFFVETPVEVYTYDLIPHVPEDFPYQKVGISDRYPWARGRVEVPVWYWKDRAIWGMTARLVRDLTKDFEF